MLKYTAIKLELLKKLYNCFVAYYVRAAPWVALSGFTKHGSSSVTGLLLWIKSLQLACFYIAWLGVALKLYGSAWECGLFVIFTVIFYSFLCYAIYWFLSQLLNACNGYSGNFSPLSRCRLSYFTQLLLRIAFTGSLSLCTGTQVHCYTSGWLMLN